MVEYANEDTVVEETPNLETAPQEVTPEQAEQYEKNIYEQMMEMTNIAVDKKYFNEDKLNLIARQVIEEYDIDKESRAEWELNTGKAVKLAKMISSPKAFPWKKAANIMYPIIAQAALQFSSRASSNLIKDEQIVKGKVVGADPDGEKRKRAERVGAHMSYQILEVMDGWEDGMDRLLMVLPIVGLAYKKTFKDFVTGKNVSEYYSADDIVVNYWAKDLESVNRITHVYTLYPNEIKERQLAKTFITWEIGNAQTDERDDKNKKGQGANSNDPDASHTFYEQHRWLDVDEDGYKEPYIVTVHRDTQKVVRIVARWDIDGIKTNEKKEVIRIEPVQYFTDYRFLPPIDGSFYPIGYGILLSNSNKIVNTTINQLLDAGTLNNLSGGFVSQKVSLKPGREGGTLEFNIGEYKYVNHRGDDLSKAFYKIPVSEPSIVLFNLLTLMIDSAKEFSASSDLMAGKPPPAGVPATTTLTMLEQGLATTTSIYRRIHRSLKKEFKKLFRLNKLYLSDIDYYRVLDSTEEISVDDYNTKDCDIVPVSDPEVITNSQRRLKAQALMELVDSGKITDPKRIEIITERYVRALGVDDIDELFPENPEPTPPTAEEQMAQRELEIKEREIAIKEEEVKIKAETAAFENEKLRQEALKAEAEANKANQEAANVSVEGELNDTKNQLTKKDSLVKSLIKSLKDSLGGKKNET